MRVETIFLGSLLLLPVFAGAVETIPEDKLVIVFESKKGNVTFQGIFFLAAWTMTNTKVARMIG